MLPPQELIDFTYSEFNKNVLADPQATLLYEWQDDCLWPFCKTYDALRREQIAAVEHRMGAWASSEGLPTIKHMFLPTSEGTAVLRYHGLHNRYESSADGCEWPMFHYIHEFTHYWLMSAFSLGYDPEKISMVTPITGHGPVFVRAFLMFLGKYLFGAASGVTQDSLIALATQSGLGVAELDEDALRQLWTSFREMDFKSDRKEARALIERLGEADRPRVLTWEEVRKIAGRNDASGIADMVCPIRN